MRNPLVTDTTLKMRLVLPLMLVLAACCWGANVPNDPILDNVEPQTITQEISDTRLPTNVVPIEYNITLQVFMSEKNNFTFNGTSVIKLDIKSPIRSITLHAKNLNIETAKLKYIDKNIEIKNITLKIITNKEKDFLILNIPLSLPFFMNNTELILTYTGKLNDDLHGFYRSSYMTPKNETRWLATTQFEPTHAREAFPCWDEPGIKAHFNIIIKNDEKYKALSNANIMSSETKNTVRTTIFKRTPKMSTYLVAFVISDFDNHSNTDEKFNVWAKPHMINSTKFAYDFGKQVLKALDDWTNIPYYNKIDKMDQISIPDFNAGAMENWGLVTYRESRLLYTEGETTTKEQQNIGTVIAHEFAHQWFGNLVTPEWWDYIWLNEGFATFFQYYIIDQFQPKNESWRLMEQFVVENVQASSFITDASVKSRPMNANPSVTTPDQISSLFDNIAYKKAACVIRMMQHFLTDTIFQKGIREYLKLGTEKNSSVVTPTDLFNSLSIASNISSSYFKMIINNWINKAGYPVVSVTRLNESNIALKQERFFLMKPLQQDKTKWYIPVEYVTQNSTAKIEWMKPMENDTILKADKDKWILINKDQIGYYRVNYDQQSLNLLVEHLKKNFSEISAVNRAQLIDDALTLARVGYSNYSSSLDITLYLEYEVDYIPWYAAARAFEYLDNMLQDTLNYELFQNYVAHKLKNFMEKVKVENITSNNTHVDKLAKVLVLNMACKYKIKTCDFAKNKFNEWLNDNNSNFSVDYRATIFCAGLMTDDSITLLNKTLIKYSDSKNPKEKADILTGLGCMRDELMIKTFLEFMLNDSKSNIFDALNSVCRGNFASTNVLLEFIKNHFEKICGSNCEHAELLTQHLNLLAHRVKTVDQFKQLSMLVQETRQGLHDKTFEGFDYVFENIDWLNNNLPIVSKWIKDNQPNSAGSFVLTSFLMIIPVLLMRL